MNARLLRVTCVWLLLVPSFLTDFGCRFGTEYVGLVEGYLPGDEPAECPEEGERLVDLNATFFPQSGATDYTIIFGFDPVDSVTRVSTGTIGRRIGSPAAAVTVLADSRWDYRFLGCVATDSYNVTISVINTTGPSTSSLFEESCDGDLTATSTNGVRFVQETASGPFDDNRCLQAP